MTACRLGAWPAAAGASSRISSETGVSCGGVQSCCLGPLCTVLQVLLLTVVAAAAAAPAAAAASAAPAAAAAAAAVAAACF